MLILFGMIANNVTKRKLVYKFFKKKKQTLIYVQLNHVTTFMMVVWKIILVIVTDLKNQLLFIYSHRVMEILKTLDEINNEVLRFLKYIFTLHPNSVMFCALHPHKKKAF
jgi:hypothetical protein